jgi:superfamily II DNA or RNA helicase
MPLPEADIVIIDECHRSMAPTYYALINHYTRADAFVLGMTATPVRADGRGLGQCYQSMVVCPSVRELTELGYLVPIEYYAPTIPDLTGVRLVRGDYDERQLQAVLNQRELVGDVITNWVRIAPTRKTIVFATGVKHSINLRDEFRKAGFKAEHIDAETPTSSRDQILQDLRNGKIQIITNCMVLTEGFDEPSLDCCVLARPTKSVGLYLQMAGRTLRPNPGKKDCILLDHSGNVYEHGFVAEPREWKLTTGKLAMPSFRKITAIEKKPTTCVKCAYIYTGQHICPRCGHVPERRGKWLETRHADLMLVDEKKRTSAKRREYDVSDKQRWYSMLLHYAVEKNKKLMWVNYTFQHKFGHWPGNMPDIPLPPNAEVLAYIRHRNIAYAHSQQRRTT